MIRLKVVAPESPFGPEGTEFSVDVLTGRLRHFISLGVLTALEDDPMVDPAQEV